MSEDKDRLPRVLRVLEPPPPPSIPSYYDILRARLARETNEDPELKAMGERARRDAKAYSVAHGEEIRAELIGDLTKASLQAESLLTSLKDSVLPELRQEIQEALGAMIDLRRAISSAPKAEVAGLNRQVTAAVQGLNKLAYQASNLEAVHTVKSADNSANPRKSVQRLAEDIFEKRTLDPYLKFGSAADGIAYREREEKRERQYSEAMATGTPEGDRRAAEIIERQLLDAGAHGATASPSYGSMLERAREARTALATAQNQNEPEGQPHWEQSQTAKRADETDAVAVALRNAGVVASANGTALPEHGLGAVSPGFTQTADPGRGRVS